MDEISLFPCNIETNEVTSTNINKKLALMYNSGPVGSTMLHLVAMHNPGLSFGSIKVH